MSLEDLARLTSTATSRADVTRALEDYARETLRPRVLATFLVDEDGRIAGASDAPAADGRADGGLARLLADPSLAGVPSLDALNGAGGTPLGGFPVRGLVPVADRRGRVLALLLLGPRDSEEPYGDEDLGRLRAAASHAAAALEVVRLAERMAERMDGERRASREIAIAREVQARLFPERVPRLRTLDLAARCIQARAVGGDYYDFLDLGPDKAGFVLADVSGKGIHAALRMANLHAHVRSQAGSAPGDPLRVLRQVNRMLCESTRAGHFATLFLGVYHDAARRLAYINCGHNPPLVSRRDGAVERLEATATVLGAFEDWECSLQRVQLQPGDLVVAYSDGITEAVRGDELFGEERLVEALRASPEATPEELVANVLDRVQEFGSTDRLDDLTLLVGRVR